MAELRSFRDVIENQYYNELCGAVSEYISENASRLDIRSRRIVRADEAELGDLTVKRVDVYDAPGSGILFDVIVEVEMAVHETVSRYREDDEASDWFRVSCKGVLDGGLQNFKITRVTTYGREASLAGKLTDNLVPVIAKEQFDQEAEAFLKACGFGEALVTPTPIPVREIVKRMGLTIKELRLTRHFTLFGEIVFSDCVIEYFDGDTREYKPLEVKRGTILVDPDVFFMRCVGCWNNTVIHECVHWFKHKKYHELTGMYDSDALRISCRVNEQDRRQKEWNPTDWMEWHANGIAPRILMPRAATIKKIEELIRKNAPLFGSDNRLAILESVLYELADFFQVSRTAAKIRMLDLGYKEAEGVYTYIDDHYISSYTFDADSKTNDQTYSISLSDSFFEYFANQDFKQIVDTGNFTYVDGHYVIDDPKYIQRTVLGGICLTDYAQNHIDECCIRFNLKYNPSAKTDVVIYLNDIKFRKATPDYNRVPEFNADKHNMDVFNRSEELKKFHANYVEEAAFLSKPFASFAQAAWEHIERNGVSRADFAEKTLLSEKIYDRIRSGELTNPKLQTVIQICIGLELGGVLGEHLLSLAGYTLNNTPQQLAYKNILHAYRGHSIYECDEILKALGITSIIPKEYRFTE